MSRVQLALRVSDLEGSVAFYSKLFGVEPAKRRPGYANFAVDQPPLKLVLIEGQPDQPTVMDHLGVEVFSSDGTRPRRRAVEVYVVKGDAGTLDKAAASVCCTAEQVDDRQPVGTGARGCC